MTAVGSPGELNPAIASVARTVELSLSPVVGEIAISLIWPAIGMTRVGNSVAVEQLARVIASNIVPTSNSNLEWLTITVNLLEFINCV